MENTGLFVYTNLIEVDGITGLPTGRVKPNIPSDPDYIPPVQDTTKCPLDNTPPPKQQKITVNIQYIYIYDDGQEEPSERDEVWDKDVVTIKIKKLVVEPQSDVNFQWQIRNVTHNEQWNDIVGQTNRDLIKYQIQGNVDDTYEFRLKVTSLDGYTISYSNVIRRYKFSPS